MRDQGSFEETSQSADKVGSSVLLPNLRTAAPAWMQYFLIAVIATGIGMLVPKQAEAVPAFAEQTGQPCAACHVGAFGPQLKQFGRDFKLNGYVASDGANHFPPIAATVQTSFTHTKQDQPTAAAPHYANNDNFAIDQVSLYYAGRITPSIGAFAQMTYDGVGRQLFWDNTDIRHAGEYEITDDDLLVYGFTFNNSPSVSDLWNSTPVWGYPYNSSKLAPTPMAGTLIDGGLGQRVVGGGAYAMLDDLLYAEFDVYRGLGYDMLRAIGNVPTAGTDQYRGAVPYWRLALQQNYGRSYFEVGGFGLAANVLPGGVNVGLTDYYVDTAADANYQFVFNPKNVTSDMISAHATYIHQDSRLNASSQLSGVSPAQKLNTFRADVSYAIAATWTPSVQYFNTSGTTDPSLWATANGSPNSSGMIVELAYVPFGKPDSPIQWGNVRFAVQYVNYFKFDGSTRGAANNNTLYFSVWFGTHF